jgi:AraC-like DNA-binding protein
MALCRRDVCPELAPFVRSLWLADAYVAGPHRRERILPTGECSLILDLPRGAAGISGPHIEAIEIETAAEFSVAGVAFTPGGIVPFVDGPATELVNQHVPLEVLWGGLAAELNGKVHDAKTPASKLAAMEQVLVELVRRGKPGDAAVRYAIRAFDGGTVTDRVGAVVGRIGLSHRRFLDLFRSEVGLTPKQFARIRRFQRVLQHIRNGGRVEWTHVALSCGYFDQSHFIREFRTFSGVTPTAYSGASGPHLNHLPISD